jgi:hypothetical protein
LIYFHFLFSADLALEAADKYTYLKPFGGGAVLTQNDDGEKFDQVKVTVLPKNMYE